MPRRLRRMRCGLRITTRRWPGRALAPFGIAPTKSSMANLTIDRRVILYSAAALQKPCAPYAHARPTVTERIPCPPRHPSRSTVFITTRHAASLRPSRNGRIGFKPPCSKGGACGERPVWIQSLYGSSGKWILINHFHFSKTVATRRAASFM